MMKEPLLFVIFLLVFTQVAYCEESNCASRMSEAAIVESNGGFALDLFKKLAEQDGNIFFSPISVSFALAMTSLGAKGNTLAQTLKILKLDSFDKEVLHSWFGCFGDYAADERNRTLFTLNLANRLFGEKSYNFLPEFLKETLQYYKAELEALDFKTDSEGARRHINQWVSDKTNEKIKDILAPGIITELTRLVLVNAIYFKADWKQQFKPNKTKEQDFHISDSEKIRVPLMHENFRVNYVYSEALKSQVAELPYKGDELSMIIILPDLEQTTLKQVEDSLKSFEISSLQFQQTKMDVWLPKFKVESSFSLNDKLKDLGMSEIFIEGMADLSGMDGTRDLYVSSVIHKAFIEVNEEGSEAAAATAVVVLTRAGHFPDPDFRADHPFLFFIRHNNTKSILFFGRLFKP